MKALLLPGLLILVAPSLQADPPSPAIRVETLRKPEETSGCGTGYFLGHKRIENQSEVFAVLDKLDGEGRLQGVIRVNGEAHLLSRIHRKDFPRRPKGSARGDRFVEVWRGVSVQIQIDCTVTELLYEATDFQGKMTVGPKQARHCCSRVHRMLKSNLTSRSTRTQAQADGVEPHGDA